MVMASHGSVTGVIVLSLLTATASAQSDALPCISLSKECLDVYEKPEILVDLSSLVSTKVVARYSGCIEQPQPISEVCVLDFSAYGQNFFSTTMCMPSAITSCFPEGIYDIASIGALNTSAGTKAYFQRCNFSDGTIVYKNKTISTETAVQIVSGLIYLAIEPKFKQGANLDIHCGDHEHPFVESPGALIMVVVSLVLGLIGLISEGMEGRLHPFGTESPKPPMVSVNAIYEDSAATSLLSDAAVSAKIKRRGLRGFVYMFNPTNNMSKLLESSPKRSLSGLDGLRAFSMLWIILAHTCLLVTEIGVENPDVFAQQFTNRFSAFATGANLAVDTFFFIAGVLTSYTTINGLRRKMIPLYLIPKQIGFFTLLRWLRLMPVYAYILFLYTYLTPTLATGPHWWKIDEDVGYCKKYWWTNFLFINNFVPENFYVQCMSWTWYLANYMQFSVVALIILYVYVRSPLVGKIFAMVITVACTIIGYITIANDAFDSHKFQNVYYDKPYTRLPALSFGIYIGMILRDTPAAQLRFSPKVSFLIRHLSIAGILSMVYLLADQYDYVAGQKGNFVKAWTSHELAAYYSFGRLFFVFCIAAITYLCTVGGAGIYGGFLNLPFWEPLGKLTFGAYLVHPGLIRIFAYNQRYYPYINSVPLALNFLGMAVVSYAFAVLAYVFIELPFESMLMGLKGKKK
eukprot:m.197621 g.197621  ORF g.197621 m.197621 type:complete len:687 (+) comp32663_c2_seq2:34-2094(+)